jgi:hypothetical protein
MARLMKIIRIISLLSLILISLNYKWKLNDLKTWIFDNFENSKTNKKVTSYRAHSSSNFNYLCESPTFSENEAVALDYLKGSHDYLSEFELCDNEALNFDSNMVIYIKSLQGLNGTKEFSITINKAKIKRRVNFEGSDFECFIQRFEKKLNISEQGEYCDWCSQQNFEEKFYLDANMGVKINRAGFYYLNCFEDVTNVTKVFDDVFMVLPQKMSQLTEDRQIYKNQIEKFKDTLNFTKFNPGLVYDVNYSGKCFSKQDHPKEIEKFNVLIIGIDSVSFNHFKRILPLTFEYLNDELEDNIVFSHLNSVDESTIYNLLPMLAGIRKNESLKIYDNIDMLFADFLPFIWNQYEEQGYVTWFNEDWPSLGLFNFYRNGFRYNPTGVYVRPYWVEYYKIRTHGYPAKCHYMEPFYIKFFKQIQVFLENMHLKNNQNTPYFSFNWLTEYTHNELAIPPNFDFSLRYFLRKLMALGYFDKTLLLFLTDHGNKLHDFAKTESGRHERLLPYLSIKFPKNLLGTTLHKNAINNKNKLISFFDIYQTLRNFLFVNKYGLENLQNENDPFCRNQFRNNSYELRNLRGISLFEEIPTNRSCADAQIPETYCSCFRKEDLDESQFLEETKNTFNSAAMIALNEIRNITYEVRAKCAPYSITSSNTFKKIVFNDGKTVYSGRMELQPGDALFEINFKFNSSNLIMNDVPIRLSRYSNQSYCVNKRILKNFCFCSE